MALSCTTSLRFFPSFFSDHIQPTPVYARETGLRIEGICYSCIKPCSYSELRLFTPNTTVWHVLNLSTDSGIPAARPSRLHTLSRLCPCFSQPQPSHLINSADLTRGNFVFRISPLLWSTVTQHLTWRLESQGPCTVCSMILSADGMSGVADMKWNPCKHCATFPRWPVYITYFAHS